VQLSYEILIEGIKPLIINTFPIDTLDSTKAKSGTSGNDQDSWKKTVLYNENRNLFVYGSYLVGSIIGGGKKIKVGKATLSKTVRSTLEVLENELLIIGRFLPPDDAVLRKPSDPVYIDVRSVVNPMTRGRNLRYRIATKPGWEIKATILWDDNALSKEQMKNCIENAGLFEGIGDGRNIGFGRYKLMSFTKSS